MQPGQAEYNNQTLTEPMINAYTEAFKRFDLDGDGYLSLKELGELLKQMGHPIDQEDLMDMTNEIDIEGNGTIDRKEFLQLMARKIRDFDDEDEYIEAFKIFDRNNDDLISVEEMKEIMTILGQWVWKVSPTDEEMVEMIREADTDSDGYLHYKDFIYKIKSIR